MERTEPMVLMGQMVQMVQMEIAHTTFGWLMETLEHNKTS